MIEFWANWCGPCHAFAPTLKRLAEKFEDQVTFAKVNVEVNRDLAGQFRVKNVPTVVLFKHGEEWERFSGLRNYSDLRKLIEKLVQ